MTEAEKEKHKKYIKKCHDLAIKSGKNGYDSFGALVVYEDEILETAQNTADYDKGLFGHAEFNVVHKCANKYSDHILKNSTLYTSCAPCVRCLLAILSPYCVEMEASAIGHFSHINKTPFLIIRSISDNANEEAEISYETFEKKAAHQSADLLLKIIGKI
jgi:tRNA(Arg) A34 adenosine deaminase TadA